MSRRKQAKPQHLTSHEETYPTGISQNDIFEGPEREDLRGGQSHYNSEETHICEKCCAEVFTWAQLCDHQKDCTEDPLVFIVQNDERMPTLEDCPVEDPAVSSVAPSDFPAAESLDGGLELGETLLNEGLEEDRVLKGPVEFDNKHTVTSSPQAPDSASSITRQMSAAGKYSMQSTNVTLEILQSTRVAVAQFSQEAIGSDPGGKRASHTIPVILEHLLALQQQQVHQLQLIENICRQVATMNKQPTQAALNPASRAPNAFLPPDLIPPSVLHLSGTMPSAVKGQASVSLSSVHERSQSLSLQTTCGQSNLTGTTCTSSSSESPAPPPSSCSSSSMSTLLPPYTGIHTDLTGCTQTLSSSSSLSLGRGSLLSAPSSMPFLPQSPPSNVIFPKPLASIAATANELDPLASLMKHQKGKLFGVSLFDTRPSAGEPFFKHKCRFCAKVFGSDSALKIHLRSHTGERPFKCNICGNRFSTKGNLKVHFQRHKEKYPHIQMNPYPVPEYLDNVPANSGIPYEKTCSSWVDSKPVVATLPSPIILPLASMLSSMGSSNGSVISSVKSPYRPVSGECVSLLSEGVASEPYSLPVACSLRCSRMNEAANMLTEGVHLPQNCSETPQANPIGVASSTVAPSVSTASEPAIPAFSVSSSPLLLFNSDQIKFSSGGLLDSTQTSETSKLQQLVENIDKKIRDPNQCVLCQRVLSCQSALKMHYRIHTGERPFKCKVCGRAFTTNGNLKIHVSVHRENPPIQVQHSCPICQKIISNAVVLQQHMHMHMGGQIPDSLMVDGMWEMDDNIFLGEHNYDSLSSNDNDLIDDISMDDAGKDEEKEEEEEEETGNAEEGVSPISMNSVCYSPPKSLPVVSNIAALEKQIRMINSTVSLNHSFGIKPLTNGFGDSGQLAINYSLTEKKVENRHFYAGNQSVSETSTSPHVTVVTIHSNSDSRINKSPIANNGPKYEEPLEASVKKERSDTPNSVSGAGGAHDLRGIQPSKRCLKEESLYSVPYQLSRERALGMINCTSAGIIKTEMNGHNQPNNPTEGQTPPCTLYIPPSIGSPEKPSLLGSAPPRRTPKQHNCSICGKNFSSASALQIHERTHTGEKPFVCSICGRAFTTKGNLKVHMGTHMWNNSPTRRGRRLSVENPMALLGGDAMKFGEMFQKDLATRPMNVDLGFWNRYAAAIANGLAIKNNEISVFKNRGIPPLHAMTVSMDRVSTRASPIASLGKTSMGANRHFSMLVDDSEEIGIN